MNEYNSFSMVSRLMFEEEENLRNGRIMSDSKVLEEILLNGNAKQSRKQGRSDTIVDR